MIKYLLNIKNTTWFLSAALLLLASCSADDTTTTNTDTKGTVTITSDIEPFEGEVRTRVNVAGNAFLNGDFIRLKIICPFVSSTERGEHTDGNSYDAMYYLKRSGSSWIRVLEADGFDITGSYKPSNSPDIISYYEAQQTPYVYVASTFSEERHFVANGTLYDHLTPVFHADQTKEKHYRASDVLWAQTFMQTGAWNIHLGFQHKMACLDITISDDVTLTNPSTAVLTLEGMPDIDQAEIVVGDYYADASKSNSGYGYQQKSSCSYENNGKVLGVAVNDEEAKRAKVAPMTGNPVPGGQYSNNYTRLDFVPNTGVYTAYMVGARHYRLIVPPCKLSENAMFWLRDGSKRYCIALETIEFVEGKLYPVTLKLTPSTPSDDNNTNNDDGNEE